MKQNIIISQNISNDLKSFLNKNNFSSTIILVDENTEKYCLPLINYEELKNLLILKINSGEKNKRIETVIQIWDKLISKKIDKNAIFINLGGGLISDIGNFVASTYKRGISCINIPTTLMAQVDASIGGKNGINFKEIKNIIGTINHNITIFVYPEFINSQEIKDIKSGFGEMIKHSLLVGGQIWEETKKIKNIDISKIKKLIPQNIKIKQYFVEKDPYDKKERHALNLGHTIGHALESISFESKKTITHGEAVVNGIVVEAIISKQKKFLNKKKFDEITSYIISHYKLQKIKSPDKILSFLKNDKKNSFGHLYFTLLKDIGQYLINVKVNEDEIKKAISEFNSLI